MNDIDNWRKKIDQINIELVELLNSRAKCAVEIGKIKKKSGKPVFDKKREETIFKSISSANNGPFGDESMERIFKVVIEETRKIEETENNY